MLHERPRKYMPSYVVQSVLCRTSHFDSRAQARADGTRLNCKTHSSGTDPNKGGAHTAYYRFRQRQPQEFYQNTFRTRKLSQAEDLIVGKLR